MGESTDLQLIRIEVENLVRRVSALEREHEELIRLIREDLITRLDTIDRRLTPEASPK